MLRRRCGVSSGRVLPSQDRRPRVWVNPAFHGVLTAPLPAPAPLLLTLHWNYSVASCDRTCGEKYHVLILCWQRKPLNACVNSKISLIIHLIFHLCYKGLDFKEKLHIFTKAGSGRFGTGQVWTTECGHLNDILLQVHFFLLFFL